MTETTEKTATATPVAPSVSAAMTRVDPLAAQRAATIAERRAINMMVATIRGQQWGLGIGSAMARTVANYCHELGLDPVRHVEVLGGKIYLTSTLYEERAAPLIRDGIVIPEPVYFINADARLDTAAKQTDDPELAEWARAENRKRMQERIDRNVPEAATATAVKRIKIASSGAYVDGVNWCGGGTRKKHTRDGLKDADPIGDLEPAKTAETRAGRRAWKQLADVLPEFAEKVSAIEAKASMINEAIVDDGGDEKVAPMPRASISHSDEAYGPDNGEAKQANARAAAGEVRTVETETVEARPEAVRTVPGDDPYNSELSLGGEQKAAAA
jgi:hypothetical protein